MTSQHSARTAIHPHYETARMKARERARADIRHYLNQCDRARARSATGRILPDMTACAPV